MLIQITLHTLTTVGQVMIDRAEARGEIKPGVNTLVEATSGNTGSAPFLPTQVLS